MSANILNKPKDANVFSKPLKSAISDQSLSLLPVLQDSVSKAVTELKAMGQSDLRAVIAKAIDHARDQLWKFTDHHVCEWERQCLDNLKFRLRSLKFEERVSDLRDVEEKLEDGKVKLYGISHNIHTEVNRLWKDLQFELNTTPQPVSGMNGICKSNLRDLQYSIIQNTVLELYVDSPEGLPKIAARVLSAVTDLRTQAEQDAKTLVQIEGTLRNQLTALRCEIPDVVSNADRDFLENIQGSVSKWLHGRLHCREIGWIGRQEPRALVEELLRKTSDMLPDLEIGWFNLRDFLETKVRPNLEDGLSREALFPKGTAPVAFVRLDRRCYDALNDDLRIRGATLCQIADNHIDELCRVTLLIFVTPKMILGLADATAPEDDETIAAPKDHPEEKHVDIDDLLPRFVEGRAIHAQLADETFYDSSEKLRGD